MQADDIVLEVRDKQLQRVGTIMAKDFDFEIADLHNDVGAFTLTIASDHPMASALRTPGAGIVLAAGGITFSGPVSQPEVSVTQEDANGTLVVKGVSDTVILGDALAYPQPSNSDVTTQVVAYDEATAKAETLMHYYVSRNIGPNGSTARKNRNLIMGTDAARGTTLTKKPRFQVLGDLLNEIAAIDGLGYRVTQRDSGLVFETYATEDRRLTVRLSTLNGQLDSQTVATSAPGVTRAIVGGTGDLVARKFVEVTTPDSLSAEENWGRRIERFVDERSTNLSAELTKAGQELLADQGFSFASVQTVPVENSSLTFGTEWQLGDLVTVEVDGVELSSFVSGYVLKADADGVRLGVVLGDPNDFAQDGGMVRQLTQVTRQVDAIQRTVETKLEVVDDTGWIDLPNTVAPGNLKYRRRNGYVTVRFIATAQTASGSTYTVNTTTLPVAYRPSANSRGACDFSGYPGAMLVNSAGNVLVAHTSGALRSTIEGLVIYPAES